jgi:hypothetical protein
VNPLVVVGIMAVAVALIVGVLVVTPSGRPVRA